jgi:hypothetical protein
MQKHAIVIQAVRENRSTGNKVLYVLAVKLANSREQANEECTKLQKKGYVVDIVLAEELPTLELV